MELKDLSEDQDNALQQKSISSLIQAPSLAPAEAQTAISYLNNPLLVGAALGELEPSLGRQEHFGKTSQTFITSPVTFWLASFQGLAGVLEILLLVT